MVSGKPSRIAPDFPMTRSGRRERQIFPELRLKIRNQPFLATFIPDNYTAIVRGKDDTTGVALVEFYNVTP